jgi:hypothetical protein
MKPPENEDKKAVERREKLIVSEDSVDMEGHPSK